MLGAVAQRADVVEPHERGAGERRLLAEHAVELGGVADGLVDLQRDLAAVDDEVARTRLDVRAP